MKFKVIYKALILGALISINMLVFLGIDLTALR